jgi:hypothetical protein
MGYGIIGHPFKMLRILMGSGALESKQAKVASLGRLHFRITLIRK